MIEDVTCVDFTDTDEAALARQLDNAFTRIGFCCFRGTSVDEGPTGALFEASQRFHARSCSSKDALVTVFPTCQGPGDPPRFPPTRYGDYLIERLDRNHVCRKAQAA